MLLCSPCKFKLSSGLLFHDVNWHQVISWNRSQSERHGLYTRYFEIFCKLTAIMMRANGKTPRCRAPIVNTCSSTWNSIGSFRPTLKTCWAPLRCTNLLQQIRLNNLCFKNWNELVETRLSNAPLRLLGDIGRILQHAGLTDVQLGPIKSEPGCITSQFSIAFQQLSQAYHTTLTTRHTTYL